MIFTGVDPDNQLIAWTRISDEDARIARSVLDYVKRGDIPVYPVEMGNGRKVCIR